MGLFEEKKRGGGGRTFHFDLVSDLRFVGQT